MDIQNRHVRKALDIVMAANRKIKTYGRKQGKKFGEFLGNDNNATPSIRSEIELDVVVRKDGPLPAITAPKPIYTRERGEMNGFDMVARRNALLPPLPIGDTDETEEDGDIDNLTEDLAAKIHLGGSSKAISTPKKKTLGPLQERSLNSGVNPRLSTAIPQSCSTKNNESPQPSILEEYLGELLRLAGSASVIQFEEFSNYFSTRSGELRKIADGSYGDVFGLFEAAETTETSGYFEDPQAPTAVFKLLPLAPCNYGQNPSKRKAKKAAKLSYNTTPVLNMVAELSILKVMANIPGFVGYRKSIMLHGPPTGIVMDALKEFEKSRKSPEPRKRATKYDPQQLWAFIEMDYAGTELEEYPINNPLEARDVFWGVCGPLAKAEERAHFEHRDLHVSNICVQKTSPANAVNSAPLNKGRLKLHCPIGLSGLEITLIDYTLSRCTIARTRRTTERVFYNDLDQDLALFQNEDPETPGNRHLAVYSKMRDSIFFEGEERTIQSKPAPPGRSWRNYHPHTNVLWLRYLIEVLFEKLQWDRTQRKYEDFCPQQMILTHKAYCWLERIHEFTFDEKCRSAGDILRMSLRMHWV